MPWQRSSNGRRFRKRHASYLRLVQVLPLGLPSRTDKMWDLRQFDLEASKRSEHEQWWKKHQLSQSESTDVLVHPRLKIPKAIRTLVFFQSFRASTAVILQDQEIVGWTPDGSRRNEVMLLGSETQRSTTRGFWSFWGGVGLAFVQRTWSLKKRKTVKNSSPVRFSCHPCGTVEHFESKFLRCNKFSEVKKPMLRCRFSRADEGLYGSLWEGWVITCEPTSTGDSRWISATFLEDEKMEKNLWKSLKLILGFFKSKSMDSEYEVTWFTAIHAHCDEKLYCSI